MFEILQPTKIQLQSNQLYNFWTRPSDNYWLIWCSFVSHREFWEKWVWNKLILPELLNSNKWKHSEYLHMSLKHHRDSASGLFSLCFWLFNIKLWSLQRVAWRLSRAESPLVHWGFVPDGSITPNRPNSHHPLIMCEQKLKLVTPQWPLKPVKMQ